MIAFVDESLRHGPGGFYVVTAVVMLKEDLDQGRAAVRGILTRRQPRFHWRNETERQRRRMLERIAELGCPVMGYMCPLTPRRPDRARALCFTGSCGTRESWASTSL
jgi:hypothetical protein